ncbi:tail fiber assembly protein [Pseudomonas sp. NPDC089734]|uniref:tail fiber assembly protein n=1 Tax=Pseudomonas sp. NPDC089734 TaxID=3364469 RepID=UPI0037FC9373
MKYLQIDNSVAVTAFGGPQDPNVWPNLIEVEDDDPRYLALIAPSEPNKTALAALTRDNLMAVAVEAMTPLLLSLQLGDATTEETASAKAWQAYVRALKLIDLTVEPTAWPEQPQ